MMMTMMALLVVAVVVVIMVVMLVVVMLMEMVTVVAMMVMKTLINRNRENDNNNNSNFAKRFIPAHSEYHPPLMTRVHIVEYRGTLQLGAHMAPIMSLHGCTRHLFH